MSANKHYIIGFKRGSTGLEEYDGGTTIADARKEAAFFCTHLPETVAVKIYKADCSDTAGLKVIEVVREGSK